MGKIFLIFYYFLWCSPLHAESIRQDIKALRQQKETLVFEQQNLLKEADDLQKMMVDLSLAYDKKKENLADHQKEIHQTLPLLARLERTNPLTMVVDPATGQYRGRGIILLRSWVSSLKYNMQQVQAALNEMTVMSTDLDIKSQLNRQLMQQIEQKKEQLSLQESQKIDNWTKAERERIDNEDDVNALLAEGRATLSKTERNASRATALKGLPFRTLVQPVVGKIFKDPALQAKFSPYSQGVFFETRKNAQVLAPARGKVVFKGPFRTHAEILIIDHGNKVQTILMGIHKINADVGKNVYAGEKLGMMAGYGSGAPRLYLELRHKGKTIDPSPYFASKN